MTVSVYARSSFTVYIDLGGEIRPVEVLSGASVQCVFDQIGIEIGEEDTVSHILTNPVRAGDVIWIEQLTRDMITLTKEVVARELEVPTSLLPVGQRRVMSVAGDPGLVTRTYSRILVNGRVIEEELIEEEVIEAPDHGRVLVGMPGARISPLNFEWQRDENGRPVDYVHMIPGQRAAGYSDRVGPTTSTGLPVAVGLVAVNPHVIPYGSLLYITSPDGSFVYGYAVAADTGGDLMRGIIGIDLFYATHEEAMLNGMRTVDIYILRLP